MAPESQIPDQASRAFSIRQLAFVITGIALSFAMIRIPFSLVGRVDDAGDGTVGLAVLFLLVPGVLGLFVFVIAPIGYCLAGPGGKKLGILLAIALWLLFVLVGLGIA